MSEKTMSMFFEAVKDTMTNHHMNWLMYIVTMLTIVLMGLMSGTDPAAVWLVVLICNVNGVPIIIISKSLHTFYRDKTLAEKTYEVLLEVQAKLNEKKI